MGEHPAAGFQRVLPLHRINPYGAAEAMELYRMSFTPSAHLAAPCSILTASVICAETNAEADALATLLGLAWLRLQAGRPGPFPSPEEAQEYAYTATEQAYVENNRARLIFGDPHGVRARLCRMVSETGADEVMATTMVHGHADRLRSYELLAQAFELPMV